VITLLLGRGHYSIDVVIAYWITTRLWWTYHTLANNFGLTDRGNRYNYLANEWWWLVFRYFEAKVDRPLPRRYNWPLPKKLLRWRPLATWRSRRSAAAVNVNKDTD
jgi:shingomyelin synthase